MIVTKIGTKVRIEYGENDIVEYVYDKEYKPYESWIGAEQERWSSFLAMVKREETLKRGAPETPEPETKEITAEYEAIKNE